MKLTRFFETIDSFGPVVLRLGLALVLLPHGTGKVFVGCWGGHGFSGTMGFFTNMLHIPAALALLVIATEFLGPIALVFGFFTRLAALAIGVNFVVAAILGGHVANGFFMNWNKIAGQGEGFEYHILMVTIALALLILGGGKCALDSVIARTLGAQKTP